MVLPLQKYMISMEPKKCMIAEVAIVLNGKILLMAHKKLGNWWYTGGHINKGELPEEAAIREGREETGIAVELINCGTQKGLQPKNRAITPLCIAKGDYSYAQGKHRHYEIIFLARPKNGSTLFRRNKKESTAMGWFAMSELSGLEMTRHARSVSKMALKKAAELGI